MHKISLPIKVKKSKAKWFYLNLNGYRNAHYQVLNVSKKNFKNEVEKEIVKLPKLNKVILRYFLYPGTAHLCDVANICSIVDKYFCDALVELGIIPDDNYTYLKGVSYEFGELDRNNPRVDVYIYELEN